MNELNIREVEEVLGIKFENYNYIKTALTHSSYAKQFKDSGYNERLEFLG
ncbi:MAG: ribonuclease III, partial [Clostridium sp.]|nr:ribonuclease III [Clostridium sp.]